jgi:hypothetical protein
MQYLFISIDYKIKINIYLLGVCLFHEPNIFSDEMKYEVQIINVFFLPL